MVTRIRKRVNSQGLRLSRQLLDRADIVIGDDVEVTVQKHKIIVRKSSHSKYDLTALVRRIPKNYKVKEVELGRPVGRERW